MSSIYQLWIYLPINYLYQLTTILSINSVYLSIICLEKVSFHSNPKEGQCQRMFNYCIIALISHASNVMLKILQARLQHYVNWELADVQAGFRKGRGTRDQIANICWIIEKAREFACFTDYAKAFDCVYHNKPRKVLKEMGTPDHLTCLLMNMCASQEEPDMEQ